MLLSTLDFFYTVLYLHYIFRSFVTLKIMTENKKVSKCAVCMTNYFIEKPGMNVTCVCVVALVRSHTFEVLRLPDTFMGLSRSGNAALSR